MGLHLIGSFHSTATNSSFAISSSSVQSIIAPTDRSFCVTEGNVFRLRNQQQELKCYFTQGRTFPSFEVKYPSVEEMGRAALEPEFRSRCPELGLAQMDLLFQIAVWNAAEFFDFGESRPMTRHLFQLLAMGFH